MKKVYQVLSLVLFLSLWGSCKSNESNNSDTKLWPKDANSTSQRKPVNYSDVVITDGKNVVPGEHVAWFLPDFSEPIVVKVESISENKTKYIVEAYGKKEILDSNEVYKLSKTYKYIGSGKKLTLNSGDKVVLGNADINSRIGTFFYARSTTPLSGSKAQTSKGNILIEFDERKDIRWGYHDQITKF